MSSNQPPPSPVAALHAPLQQLTLSEWDRWGLEIPALIEIRSPADLHQWLNAATPAHAAALLAGFARLAPSDDLALAALAWLLTGVLSIAGTQTQDPHNFLDRAESTLRTIPWDRHRRRRTSDSRWTLPVRRTSRLGTAASLLCSGPVISANSRKDRPCRYSVATKLSYRSRSSRVWRHRAVPSNCGWTGQVGRDG